MSYRRMLLMALLAVMVALAIVLGTLLVAGILYSREFKSEVLALLED